MGSINNVPITADSIIKCYKKFYPDSYNEIADKRLFHYLHLWSIRVGTHDTGLADDYLGGLRINNLGFNEIKYSTGSTDPSPRWLLETYTNNAAKLGGTAWIMEGQYTFQFNGFNHGGFAPDASFCPTKPVKVYRWPPSADDKKLIQSGKFPSASLFDKAYNEGKVKSSTSPDVCIHKAWNTRFWGDSAGCQIYSDVSLLNEIGKFAQDHIAKKYGNMFMYTVFTKKQFIQANGVAVPTDKASAAKFIKDNGRFGGAVSTLETFDEPYLIAWSKGIIDNAFSFEHNGKRYATMGGGYTVY